MDRVVRARKRICVVTGARSEYGLLRWLMSDLRAEPHVNFQLVVTGSHLSPEYGNTYQEIEKDGFEIHAKVPAPFNPASGASLAKAVGTWIQGFADTFSQLQPDLVIVLGDRYEMLAIGSACTLLSIPLAHISGGDITEGMMDDQIRHAMTKLSHLHFVAHEAAARVVRQMGEEPWRICISGDPGLDYIKRLTFFTPDALKKEIGLNLEHPTALVTFHPTTLERIYLPQHLNELLSALEKANLQYIVTYPNADVGSDQIIDAFKEFGKRNPDSVRLVKNLGQTRYLSVLQNVGLMIGNSSSGLLEAPSFNLPVVNIGDRQRGRLRGKNVLDVKCQRTAIEQGIRKALRFNRRTAIKNPYGDGQASLRIRKFLHQIFQKKSKEDLLRKRFVQL